MNEAEISLFDDVFRDTAKRFPRFNVRWLSELQHEQQSQHTAEWCKVQKPTAGYWNIGFSESGPLRFTETYVIDADGVDKDVAEDNIETLKREIKSLVAFLGWELPFGKSPFNAWLERLCRLEDAEWSMLVDSLPTPRAIVVDESGDRHSDEVRQSIQAGIASVHQSGGGLNGGAFMLFGAVAIGAGESTPSALEFHRFRHVQINPVDHPTLEMPNFLAEIPNFGRASSMLLRRLTAKGNEDRTQIRDFADQPKENRDRASKETEAIALLLTMERPSIPKIADSIRVPRTTLSGWPNFMNAYNRSKGNRTTRTPSRGRKENREIEAWREADDE